MLDSDRNNVLIVTRRILLFPQGNTQPDSCAAYLECQPEDHDETIPPDSQPDWACCAQFMIVIWNKNDPTIYNDHGMHQRNVYSQSLTAK